MSNAAAYRDWARDAYDEAQNDIRRGLSGKVALIGSAVFAALRCADHCIDSMLIEIGEPVPGSTKERIDAMSRFQPPFADGDVLCYSLLVDEVEMLRRGTASPNAQTVASQVIGQYLPCVSNLIGIPTP